MMRLKRMITIIKLKRKIDEQLQGKKTHYIDGEKRTKRKNGSNY